MKTLIINNPQEDLFVTAIQQLTNDCKTIRNKIFLQHCSHDTNYSYENGRILHIGIVMDGPKYVGIAVCKSQHRKRGIWGRYATLTYAFTDWNYRKRGIAKKLCRDILNETKADRVKSLAASLAGLELHRSLGHTFWGLNVEGKVIIDSLLFGDMPCSLGLVPMTPNQVKTSNGTMTPTMYEHTLSLFKQKNIKNYMFRDDPQECFLNGSYNNKEMGYEEISFQKFLNVKANTKDGEMLRYMDAQGKFIKKPILSEKENLICLWDTISPHIWYFCGNENGLKYRATVAKKGEIHAAAIWK